MTRFTGRASYEMRIELRLTLITALLLACAPVPADDPPWQQATAWPDRIIATLDEQPSSGFSVSWRTEAAVQSAVAEIVEARAGARFDVGARTVTAQTERFEFDPELGARKCQGRTPLAGTGLRRDLLHTRLGVVERLGDRRVGLV